MRIWHECPSCPVLKSPAHCCLSVVAGLPGLPHICSLPVQKELQESLGSGGGTGAMVLWGQVGIRPAHVRMVCTAAFCPAGPKAEGSPTGQWVGGGMELMFVGPTEWFLTIFIILTEAA